MAAIQEKRLPLNISRFVCSFRFTHHVEYLLRAIDWCMKARGCDNLSLGTPNPLTGIALCR